MQDLNYSVDLAQRLIHDDLYRYRLLVDPTQPGVSKYRTVVLSMNIDRDR